MNDEEGLTVIEYVIGAAMLVLGLTTIFTGIGTALSTKLSTVLIKLARHKELTK